MGARSLPLPRLTERHCQRPASLHLESQTEGIALFVSSLYPPSPRIYDSWLAAVANVTFYRTY